MWFFDKKIVLATHNGSFHADECFAIATILLWAEKFGKKVKIVRTRNERMIEKADIVVDIGMQYDYLRNRFDHHQQDGAGKHDNGIPYASFGLVWKHFGTKICSVEASKEIESKIVAPIDARDNGIALSEVSGFGIYDYRVSEAVSSFNPVWNEGQKMVDKQFDKVVGFVKDILSREIINAEAEIESTKIVRGVITKQNNPDILVLDKYISWEKEVSRSKYIKLVVYKHRNNVDWCVQSARDDLENYNSDRAKLPKEWWGLREEDLQSVSKIKDAVFCANGGWFGVAKTKESALEMAKIALQ